MQKIEPGHPKWGPTMTVAERLQSEGRLSVPLLKAEARVGSDVAERVIDMLNGGGASHPAPGSAAMMPTNAPSPFSPAWHRAKAALEQQTQRELEAALAQQATTHRLELRGWEDRYNDVLSASHRLADEVRVCAADAESARSALEEARSSVKSLEAQLIDARARIELGETATAAAESLAREAGAAAAAATEEATRWRTAAALHESRLKEAEAELAAARTSWQAAEGRASAAEAKVDVLQARVADQQAQLAAMLTRERPARSRHSVNTRTDRSPRPAFLKVRDAS